MDQTIERQLEEGRVRNLANLASQRGLTPPLDLDKDLKSLTLSDVIQLRRALHELVYAPPVSER